MELVFVKKLDINLESLVEDCEEYFNEQTEMVKKYGHVYDFDDATEFLENVLEVYDYMIDAPRYEYAYDNGVELLEQLINAIIDYSANNGKKELARKLKRLNK